MASDVMKAVNFMVASVVCSLLNRHEGEGMS